MNEQQPVVQLGVTLADIAALVELASTARLSQAERLFVNRMNEVVNQQVRQQQQAQVQGETP